MASAPSIRLAEHRFRGLPERRSSPHGFPTHHYIKLTALSELIRAIGFSHIITIQHNGLSTSRVFIPAFFRPESPEKNCHRAFQVPLNPLKSAGTLSSIAW